MDSISFRISDNSTPENTLGSWYSPRLGSNSAVIFSLVFSNTSLTSASSAFRSTKPPSTASLICWMRSLSLSKVISAKSFRAFVAFLTLSGTFPVMASTLLRPFTRD